MRVPLNAKQVQLLSVRFTASALQLGMTLALTRTTDAATAAACLVQFSWVQLIAAAIAWGHPVSVMRDASASYVRGRKYSIRPHLRWVIGIGGSMSLLATLGTILFLPIDTLTVALVAVAGLSQALVRVTSQALKASNRETLAILLEFSAVPAALLLTTIGFATFSSEITSVEFAFVQASTSIASLVAISIFWRTTSAPSTPDATFVESETRRKGSLHYLGLLQLINIGATQIPIVISPALLDATSVASFAVAFRLASLVGTVQNALSGYYGPRYARAYARNSKNEVAHLLRSSQTVAAILCAPVVLVIPWSGQIIQMFGDGYADAGWTYAIVAFGQYINAVTGLVSYVLSLSHREVSLIIVNLLSMIILALGWGLMWATNSDSIILFSLTFSTYLAARNIINYALARRLLRSM